MMKTSFITGRPRCADVVPAWTDDRAVAYVRYSMPDARQSGITAPFRPEGKDDVESDFMRDVECHIEPQKGKARISVYGEHHITHAGQDI